MQQKVVILGSGESGTGAALLAVAKGYKVFVSDAGTIVEKYKQKLTHAGIPFEEGRHTEEHILAADIIIKSPGIPEKAPIMIKIRGKGILVISEIDFAARHTSAKIVAVTGSNGKTTTTLLIYHLLRHTGFNVGLAGNVGNSFAECVLNDHFDYYVLEVSSFQLDDSPSLKPHVAILLNITPDHLDRYDYDFQKYKNSKFKIANNLESDNFFIYGADSQEVLEEIKQYNIRASLLPFSERDIEENNDVVKIPAAIPGVNIELEKNKIPIPGRHNLLNMYAALMACTALKVDPEKLVEAFYSFKNAPHRMEQVGVVAEVVFINDSKATNVDSVWYALDSIKNKRIIWIAGGIDKGNDYEILEPLVTECVKTLVCMGKDNEKLENFFRNKIENIHSTESIDAAVREAFKAASPGDIVLLSPACASFDLFKNYEDRGDKFRKEVEKLKESVESVRMERSN